MSVLSRLVLMTVGAASALVPAGATPVAAAPGDSTFVTINDSYGDTISTLGHHAWIGADQMTVQRDADDVIWIFVDDHGGQGRAMQASLAFGAPAGQSLSTGVYDEAQKPGSESDGHPRMSIYGDVRIPMESLGGCEGETGTFIVLDMAPDLSRFRIRYHQDCGGYPGGLWGEVSYHEPGDGQLTVAPDRLDWPDSYRDADHAAPVTLANTGVAPVEVTDASITAGSAEFSVTENDCGALTPGDRCQIDVTFSPTLSGSHQGELTIHDSTTTGTRVIPLSGGAIPGYTSWSMHSQEGNWIGGGTDPAFTPANSVLSIWAYPLQVDLKLRGRNDEWWYATFSPPRGELLQAGRTYTAARAGYQDEKAGIDVSGNGAGCNMLNGSFTVRELDYADGRVRSFSATFMQRCYEPGGPQNGPALTGSVAYHADQPAAAVPVATRMTPRLSVARAPSRVSAGGRATISGTLVRTLGSEYWWLPGKRVAVYTRPHGVGSWRLVGSAVTRRDGTYSLPVTVRRTSDFRARYAGNRDFNPVVTSTVTVSVR